MTSKNQKATPSLLNFMRIVVEIRHWKGFVTTQFFDVQLKNVYLHE